jgi:surface antigen
LALHTGQVVLQNRFGVNQQATNQGGFAIIHRAAGDEFQGGACSGADHQK